MADDDDGTYKGQLQQENNTQLKPVLKSANEGETEHPITINLGSGAVKLNVMRERGGKKAGHNDEQVEKIWS